MRMRWQVALLRCAGSERALQLQRRDDANL
jgi:hypothetical protein